MRDRRYPRGWDIVPTFWRALPPGPVGRRSHGHFHEGQLTVNCNFMLEEAGSHQACLVIGRQGSSIVSWSTLYHTLLAREKLYLKGIRLFYLQVDCTHFSFQINMKKVLWIFCSQWRSKKMQEWPGHLSRSSVSGAAAPSDKLSLELFLGYTHYLLFHFYI